MNYNALDVCKYIFLNIFDSIYTFLFYLYILYIFLFYDYEEKIDLSCLNLKFIFSITEFQKDILIIYLKLSIEY